MNHKNVLKRAWDTTLRYPALLIFGLILALTAGGGRGGGGGGGGRYTLPGRGFPGEWGYQAGDLDPELVELIVALAASFCCLGLVAAIAMVVVRYVSDSALVRMVNEHEETGETRGVKQGFQLGWSRASLRFFGIDLVTGIPMFLGSIILIALSLAPLALWLTDSATAGMVGTVAAIGLFFLVVLLLIVVGAALGVLVDLARRASAVEDLGVMDAIRRAYRMLRSNPRDAALMWLIMLGLKVGWAIALSFVMALLLLLASVVGGLPGLLAGSLLGAASDGYLPWVVGGLVAAPAFIFIVGLPSLVLGGFAEVFKSSVWTLTYRELRDLGGAQSD